MYLSKSQGCREKKKERFYQLVHSPKCHQQSGLDEANATNQEFHLSLLYDW